MAMSGSSLRSFELNIYQLLGRRLTSQTIDEKGQLSRAPHTLQRQLAAIEVAQIISQISFTWSAVG